MTPVHPPTTPPAPATAPPGRRRRRAVHLALGLALLVGVGLIGRWGYGRSQLATHLSSARAAANDGRQLDAVRHLQACQQIDPDDRTVLLLAARVARQSFTFDKAEELLDHYWQRHGEDDALTFERLLLKAAADDTDAVLGVLATRAEAGGETAAQCRHAVASGFLRDYRYAEVRQVLDAWLREDPDATLPMTLLGRMQEQQLQSDAAADTYAAVVARRPDHLDARLRLVRTLMERRTADEALVHLAVLHERLPGHPEVLLQRALALRQVGRTAEAAAALDELLKKTPNSPAALTERAAMALNDGDDQRAAELLERVLKVEPGSVGARNLLAQAYARLGRPADAAVQEDEVRKLTADSDRLTELVHGPLHTRPTDPAPPHEIAGIALRSGQVKEAIHWYQLALKRDPGYAPSHTALAVIYQEVGNPVLATKHRAQAAGKR